MNIQFGNFLLLPTKLTCITCIGVRTYCKTINSEQVMRLFQPWGLRSFDGWRALVHAPLGLLPADAAGEFRIRVNGFLAPTCVATVVSTNPADPFDIERRTVNLDRCTVG